MIPLQIFASTGIGLLIGVLLGLSTSPVVGLVVGAVASLLASLLGLVVPGATEKSPQESVKAQKLVGLRAGVFGFTCLIGVGVGIYIRTHNLLSPPDTTLLHRYDQLMRIGYAADEARRLAVNYERQNSDEKNPREKSASDSILFSDKSKACEKIITINFANMDGLITYLDNLQLYDYKKIAVAIHSTTISDEQQLQLMGKVLVALCVPQ